MVVLYYYAFELFQLLILWIKSSDVAIQMKAVEQYLSLVLFNMLYKMVLTFMIGDEMIHFTVVCLMTWPLSGSEAGVDLVLFVTNPPAFSYANTNWLA